MKNKNQFFVAIVVIVACYIASFVMSYISLDSVIEDNSRQMTAVISERIHDAINNELTKSIAVSRTMARDEFLIERLKHENEYDLQTNVKDFADFLTSIREGLGYESTFLVSDGSRYYYSHAGLNKKIDVVNDAHDIWYKVFVEQNKEYELNVDEDQTKQDSLTIFINTRIEDTDGKLIGVCGMGVQMDNLVDMLRQYEEMYHVNIDMVDQSGLVLVDTDVDNIEHTIDRDVPTVINSDNEYVFKLMGNSFVGTRYVPDLSWFLVIRNKGDYVNSAYTKLLINYLIMLGILVVLMLISIYVVMRRESLLDASSSIEVLTGLNSRRVYEEYLTLLRSKGLREVTYVSLDLNGLKRVNDNQGHLAGDELITAAGNYIRDYFGNMGRCFRIGGDEFAVIIDHCNVDKEKMYREFKDLVADWHGSLAKELSISVGIVCGSDHDIEDLKKLIELADIEMYKDKAIYYQTHKR